VIPDLLAAEPETVQPSMGTTRSGFDTANRRKESLPFRQYRNLRNATCGIAFRATFQFRFYAVTVYDGVVMRTNVELDDRLVDEVMRRYRLRTKREAVDLALRRLVDEPLDLAEALALEGSGWDGDLAELRKSRRATS
jgi:Arc/MetJ family transcription regulator